MDFGRKKKPPVPPLVLKNGKNNSNRKKSSASSSQPSSQQPGSQPTHELPPNDAELLLDPGVQINEEVADQSDSLFQGENRIFPSRQSAANLEKQGTSCAQNTEDPDIANRGSLQPSQSTVHVPKPSASMPHLTNAPVNCPSTSKNVEPEQLCAFDMPFIANRDFNPQQLEENSRDTSEDRMGDDGYPLVVGEFGPSDRQNILSRNRQINDVIEQIIDDYQDAVADDELENVREVEQEEAIPPPPVVAKTSSCSPSPSTSGTSCSRGRRQLYSLCPDFHPQAAVAKDYPGAIVFKQCENAATGKADSRENAPSPRPVNILPASRSLVEHHASNLIAIGRRPQNNGENSGVTSSVAGTEFQNRVNRQRTANAAGENKLGWQASKNTLKERMSYMYCNDFLADVYFIVGKEDNRQRIPAHKFVLSVGSVVFDAMFNGGLTPQNPDPLEIELPDVEPSAFLTLLRFLYSDEVEIGPESVMTTLYTAKKYAVPAMEKACVKYLTLRLDSNNACMLLTQARLFDEPKLEKACLEQIDRDTLEIMNGEEFTEIDLETLCLVLRRDSLKIREALLFQAVIRWVDAQCRRKKMAIDSETKRKLLGDTIQLIRFPLMTVEEFAQTAAQSGLLTDKEVVDLFLYYTVSPKPKTPYCDRPRSAISVMEATITRFQRVENRWGYCGTSDRIKFTVDRRIFVVGFGLYGSVHGPHEYLVQIKIIHCGTGKTLAENDTGFVCDGTAKPSRVCFKEPVEILPGITYTASACLKGPDSFYGTKGLRRIVHQASEVTFQFTYAAMNNNGTSVEDGQIPEIVFFTANS